MQQLSRILVTIGANKFSSLSLFHRGLAGSVIDTSSWVATVGLEIHAQLTSAKTKLFSRASYSFAAPPNSQVEPFDAAIPGTMPMLNRTCVKSAIVAALGLNCRVNSVSRFERKHYFYSDSPSGYQITQQAEPIAKDGWLEYLWTKAGPQISRATIQRIQLEQDSAKSLHDERNARSLIDLNRAGVGLIEIVTRPDFSSGIQAVAFVEELSCLLAHLRVCTADMSTGQIRVDCNISIGSDAHTQGPVVEVKNVNSLRAIRHAVDYEIKRQFEIVQRGEAVINETRSFDAVTNKTTPMRDKEIVQDYRFLPEPDLPLLRLTATCPSCSSNTKSEKETGQLCVGCIKQAFSVPLSTLPGRIRRKLVFEHLLSPEKAAVLITTPPLLQLYNDTLLLSKSENLQLVRKETAYWCTGLLYSLYQKYGEKKLPSALQMAEFVALNNSGQLFGTGAEKVLSSLCESRELIGSLEEFVQANLPDCLLIADENVIRPVCQRFVKDHEKQMAKLANMKTMGNGKKRKRMLQNLANRLISSPEYLAVKFNPMVVERLIVEVFPQLNPVTDSKS